MIFISVNWFIITVSVYFCNFIHNIQTFNYFTKNSICSVKTWCAPYSFIHITLFFRNFIIFI